MSYSHVLVFHSVTSMFFVPVPSGLQASGLRYCTQLASQMYSNVHLDCHLWIYFAHIAFGHASLASCILDRTPAQAIITASHPRTQLSLTSPPQTQTHRTSALTNKTTSPRPLANPEFYSSPIPSHTQSHKSNHRYNSPTQTPVQVTTINYPIRFTPPSPFALHLQLRPLYANRSYINSSNEQAYLPAYPSASTREYNIPNNMHRPPCPPAGSYHGLPASA
jgi:hypothetical protein